MILYTPPKSLKFSKVSKKLSSLHKGCVDSLDKLVVFRAYFLLLWGRSGCHFHCGWDNSEFSSLCHGCLKCFLDEVDSGLVCAGFAYYLLHVHVLMLVLWKMDVLSLGG